VPNWDLMRASSLSISAFLVLCLMMAGCSTVVPVSPVIPDALKAPETQRLKHVVEGKGVQIYNCRRRKDSIDGYAWEFSAPEAQLTDEAGRPFGHHYAGPTWEALDGSKVTGQIKARDPGPDAGAIPWLLLSASVTSGPGRLAHIVSIQRLKTVGGQAPTSGCNANAIDQSVRVPYQAEYRFYEPRP
jgi:hypothetical protein